MKIGDKFTSFQELTEKIQNYENTNFVKLWIRDSRKLEAAKHRYPKKIGLAKAELVYYEIKYICIHGGTFTTTGKGIRKSKTYRNKCPAFFNIRLSEDGAFLEIKSMNDTHNHEISEELYNYLPQQKKLPGNLQANMAMHLELRAIKNKIQQQLAAESDKLVLLRDLTNIQVKNASEMKNNLNQVVSDLKSKWNANVELFLDSNNILQGLVFQDYEMKRIFNCYPEIIFCDATYKVLNFSCFFIVVEDSNGESEIVYVGILVNEKLENLQWLIETFKKHNIRSHEIKVIITNKDLKERTAFRNAFPNAKLFLCLFHTLQAFKKETSHEKLSISASQRACALELLQKMAYAKSENEYNHIYQIFRQSVPGEILTYFNKNWHPIRFEWVLGMSCLAGNFFQNINNRLESLNSKLKSVVNPHSSLEVFIDSFFSLLSILRQQKDQKVANLILKRPSLICNSSNDVGLYRSYLTPYAFKYLENQFDLLAKINMQDIVENDDEFTIKIHESVLVVKKNSCTCNFRKMLYLPCSHIMAVRKKRNLPIFSENLCDKRWTMQYYKECQLVFNSSNLRNEQGILPKLTKKTEAFTVANELASVMSVASSKIFDQRIEALNLILNKWKENKEITAISFYGDTVINLEPSDPEVNLEQSDPEVINLAPSDPEDNLILSQPQPNIAHPEDNPTLSPLQQNIADSHSKDIPTLSPIQCNITESHPEENPILSQPQHDNIIRVSYPDHNSIPLSQDILLKIKFPKIAKIKDHPKRFKGHRKVIGLPKKKKK